MNKDRMTESMPETTAVSTTNNDYAAVDMLGVLKDTKAAFFSTIPDDGTRENKIKIYNALNGDGENLTDHFNEKLNIENIVAFPVKFIDDDGEIVETLRITLVTDTGETYSTVSSGVLSSLQKIMAIVGSAPWTPCITVVANEVKTRKGFKTVVLTIE